MNRRSSRTCCLILGATVLATVAQAQEAQPSAQDGYEDRLIDGGNLQPDLSFEEVAGPDAGGWPRAFQVQAMTSEVSRDGSDIREHGLRFSGMLDTPQHGALTLDAHIRASSGDGDGSGNLVTLVQRSLPMNGDWFINNTLGVANTPATDLARQQQRFSVPTLPMSGAVVEWTGRDAAPGEPGELCVKGPQVMSGYWGNEAASREAFTTDGYLRTGDVAVMDARGYFRIVDRKKDMISVSGLKAYPNEIENVVTMHPAVLEAACIGVPDPATREAVKVFVVLRPGMNATADDIRNLCREHLAAYKVPKHVEFRSSLPKSNVGKILRRELR